ncbi:hypothetical protein BDE36_2987 [Arcticibacter tournemirensis]|uniref:Uncharacterized protein n=2 Tax=Arcticibacter tournemirensis TaxID=699437 RepID=A0A4Q0MH80_9SPHI|nr:hypothetical protein [Arcticibacter tournemirensis]KAA8477139.1 hypothetical protein F1649_19065 [Arcticibacter tournemirensis]RXF72336.1 hypothetical protein EKH83_01000 [Arcticibacter tournemirensis]TQM51215.1 hypothetical protein BDE36_2987 [Arcticibacter tournemirensis]
MRIVAELPRPDCKITIFSMNMKFLVKFEQGNLEQTYKISEMDVTGGVNGVFQILDEEFIEAVVKRFEGMRNDFSLAWKRYEA